MADWFLVILCTLSDLFPTYLVNVVDLRLAAVVDHQHTIGEPKSDSVPARTHGRHSRVRTRLRSSLSLSGKQACNLLHETSSLLTR